MRNSYSLDIFPAGVNLLEKNKYSFHEKRHVLE